MRRLFYTTVLITVSMLWTTGCSSPSAKPGGSGGADETTGKALAKDEKSNRPSLSSNIPIGPQEVAKPRIGLPVTEGEFFEAGIAIEASSADPLAYSSHFDTASLLDTSTADLSLKPFDRLMLKAGIGPHNALYPLIKSFAGAGSSNRLLRVRMIDGAPYALMRRVLSEQVHYLDLKLAKDKAGKVQVLDIYNFQTGELMSQTFRRWFLRDLSELRPDLVKSLSEANQDFAANHDQMEAIIQTIEEKNYPSALDTIKGLPLSVQNSKPLLINRMIFAHGAKLPTDFQKAAETYRREFPGEPAVDLQCLYFYLEHQEFAECLAAIDRIDQFIGGDVHLNLFRAKVAEAKGEFDQAEKYFELAIADPLLDVESYWQLIEFTMRRKEFEKTLSHLIDVESRFNFRIDDLTTSPEYAPFIASPQYQQWLKRGEKPPE